jgi:hypothetical protein
MEGTMNIAMFGLGFAIGFFLLDDFWLGIFIGVCWGILFEDDKNNSS